MLCSRMDKVVIALAVASLLSLAWGEIDQKLQNREEEGSDGHAGPCKKSSNCQPMVIPSNSTHLNISWKGVFEGCRDDHIEVADVVVTQGRRSRNVYVNLSQESVTVKADPCFHHSFKIYLSFTESYEEDYERDDGVSSW